jgi:hypothetical protein
MRPPEEIAARIQALEGRDFFGCQRAALMHFLDYARAQPFLKDRVSAAQFELVRAKGTPADLIRGIMPRAWQAVNERHGAYAHRRISELKAWLWIDGKDALAAKMRLAEFWGKPALVLACDAYGIAWRPLDDGKWYAKDDAPLISADEALRRGAAPP